MSPGRHFLAIPDFSKPELLAVFDLAARMKRGDYRDKPLQGKTLGMIFAKSSTRTRVSFEVGLSSWAGTRFSSPRATSSSAGASRSATPPGSSPAISTGS